MSAADGPGASSAVIASGEVIDLARALRRRGRFQEALALLNETLSQRALATPATVDLAAKVGWITLERGGLCLDAGALAQADADASSALRLFESAQHRAGAGFAALLAGDVAAAGGGLLAAARWWQSALALGDAAGNGALAARALCSLLVTGATEQAGLDLDGVATAARLRLDAPATDALGDDDDAKRAAQAQQDAAEATLALCATRDALRGGRLGETRLLLPPLLEAAQRLGEPGLLVDAMRLDATLARRGGDARAAIDSLARAEALALQAGLARLAAVVRTERLLALAEDERWGEAFELAAEDEASDDRASDDGASDDRASDDRASDTPEATALAAVRALPAVAAARLEAFALLSLRAHNPVAARRAIDEAMVLRQAIGDAVALARTGALAAEVALADGDPVAAAALAQAIDDGEHAPADALVAGVLVAGLADNTRGRSIATATVNLARFDAVASVAHAASLPAQVALALARAEALASLDQAAAAIAAVAQAQKLATTSPMLRSSARVAAAEAALALRLGDPTAALGHGKRALELAAKASDRRARAEALVVVGGALARLGRLDEAALAFGHGHDEAAGLTNGTVAVEALIAHGELARRAGDVVHAGALFERARDAARKRGATGLLARAVRGLGLLAAQAGDGAGATRTLQSAIAIGDGDEADLARLDLARLRLAAATAAIRPAVATEIVAALHDGLDQMPSGEHAGQAGFRVERALLVAEAMCAIGRHPEANALLAQHRDIAAALDPSPFGALLLMLGQLQIAAGDGAGGGATLAQALDVAGRVGAVEAGVVRGVIERLRHDADT